MRATTLLAKNVKFALGASATLAISAAIGHALGNMSMGAAFGGGVIGAASRDLFRGYRTEEREEGGVIGEIALGSRNPEEFAADLIGVMPLEKAWYELVGMEAKKKPRWFKKIKGEWIAQGIEARWVAAQAGEELGVNWEILDWLNKEQLGEMMDWLGEAQDGGKLVVKVGANISLEAYRRMPREAKTRLMEEVGEEKITFKPELPTIVLKRARRG